MKKIWWLLIVSLVLVACGDVSEEFVDETCQVQAGQYLCQVVQSEDPLCVLGEEYDNVRWIKLKEPCLCSQSSAQFMETKGDCDWSCSYKETYSPGEIEERLYCTITCPKDTTTCSTIHSCVFLPQPSS